MEIPSFLIKHETPSHIVFLPEDDDGYIEYKLRLDTKGKFGLEKLYSQMNWRLEEGQSLLGKKEAHYLLGVKDDGELGGLTLDEINATFDIFLPIVQKCGADVIGKIERTYEKGSIIYAIVSKKERRKIKEVNVAFVGPCQHGKTTTIGNLVHSCPDDGNGYTRSLIFKHEHEKITGNTSSVKKEILGIKGHKIVNYASGMKGEWGDIVNMSDRIVNLIDLPGHLKYLKTTLFGLEAYDLDAICIIVDKEKLMPDDTFIIELFKNYAIALGIQYTIVWIDEPDIENPVVPNELTISNKSRGKLQQLENFLCEIVDNVKYTAGDAPMLFSVIEKYTIQDSGIIFSGIVKYGNLELGQKVMLTNGKDYLETTITSIHKKQIDSQTLYQKETGAIMLDIGMKLSIDISKYVVITDTKYQILDEIRFELLWSSLREEDLRLIAQRALLFVDNNIVQVMPEVISYENGRMTLLLKFEAPDIIPVLAFKPHVMCFLKNAHGVFIGKI
jgi:GTPase